MRRVRNYCPPQADFFLHLVLCECIFSLKNSVFDCIRVLKSPKFSGLRPDQIQFFGFSDTNNPDFFLPDTNNHVTTPPTPGGVLQILLKSKCFTFYQYLIPYDTRVLRNCFYGLHILVSDCENYILLKTFDRSKKYFQTKKLEPIQISIKFTGSQHDFRKICQASSC